MNRAETTIRMSLEVSLGYEWGDPRSLVEQTDENKEQWDRLAEQTQTAKARKWIIEIPDDLPDISDYRSGSV